MYIILHIKAGLRKDSHCIKSNIKTDIFFFFDTVDILEKEFLLVNGHCLSDEFEEYWWKTLLKYPHLFSHPLSLWQYRLLMV